MTRTTRTRMHPGRLLAALLAALAAAAVSPRGAGAGDAPSGQPVRAETEEGDPLCGSSSRFLAALYRRVLDRDPSPRQLADGVAALRNGLPRQEVIRGLFDSDGYGDRRRRDEAFVGDAFAATMAREPEPGEAREWTDIAARITPSGLVDRLLASPEFARRVAACRGR